jgi:hypothetical protein
MTEGITKPPLKLPRQLVEDGIPLRPGWVPCPVSDHFVPLAEDAAGATVGETGDHVEQKVDQE